MLRLCHGNHGSTTLLATQLADCGPNSDILISSHVNLSIGSTQEKHYFCNPYSLGSISTPPATHLRLQQSSLTMGFPVVVNPQLNTLF